MTAQGEQGVHQRDPILPMSKVSLTLWSSFFSMHTKRRRFSSQLTSSLTQYMCCTTTSSSITSSFSTHSDRLARTMVERWCLWCRKLTTIGLTRMILRCWGTLASFSLWGLTLSYQLCTGGIDAHLFCGCLPNLTKAWNKGFCTCDSSTCWTRSCQRPERS